MAALVQQALLVIMTSFPSALRLRSTIANISLNYSPVWIREQVRRKLNFVFFSPDVPAVII